MKNTEILTLKVKIETVMPTLNEYQRRIFLSAKAKALGHGGISLVSRISGVSRQTLTEGMKELNKAKNMEVGRSRKAGGGRKRIIETQPGVVAALEELVEAHTKGDPMRELLWTNKSLRNLEKGLAGKGFKICYRVIGDLLKQQGYGLQADKKALTITASHPDRDAQFEHINDESKRAVAEGNPVISIDAKKKEKVGNFKNDGETYQKHKTPIEVLDHDFPIKELGKATPYGVYNIYKNQGFVSVGISSDTAAFAVESIRKWWYAEGRSEYANAEKIVITADSGGSNGNRNRLWKFELQKLANEINKDIQVLHYPAGTSKWNKIEHRMFAFITENWQGVPLVSTSIIVNLIGATTTEKGLSIRCVLDEDEYEKGIEVSKEDFEAINILKDEFHPEWNYTICRNISSFVKFI
jgi:hypothetical protein